MKKYVLVLSLLLILLVITSCKTKVDDETKEESETEENEVDLTIDVENKTMETESETNATFILQPKASPTAVPKIEEPKPLGFDFEIYYPKPDFRLPGPLLSLSLSLDNFSISKQGDVKKWGYGYFLVHFDDSNVTHVMDKASKTFRGISIGKHTVYVEIVQSDGTSYGITKSVNFEVPDRDETALYK